MNDFHFDSCFNWRHKHPHNPSSDTVTVNLGGGGGGEKLARLTEELSST